MAKSTLYLPVQLGGLTLPNFQVYYWAAVLVTVYWWFVGLRSNAVCVEAACLGSLSYLQNLVYRGIRVYDAVPGPTRAMLWVWIATGRRFLQAAR